MSRAPRSLRVVLTAAFVVVGVVPAVLLGGYALVTTLTELRGRESARNALVAHAVAGEIDRFLDAQLLHLREIELAVEAPAAGVVARREAHMALHLATNRALKSILLVSTEGRVVSAVPEDRDLVGIDLSGQPWWRAAAGSGRPTWSSAAISLQTGQPTVILVVPGERWAVVGYLDLEVLRAMASRGGGQLQAASVAVLDGDGTYIAHPDDTAVRERVNVRDVPLVRAALAGQGGSGEAVLLGRRVLASTARVAANGWLVLVSEPVEAALAPVARTRNGLLAALGAALFLSLGAGVALARRVVRPVEALAHGARALASGEATGGFPRAGLREPDELAGAFESMAVAVQAREEALARSEHAYRRLVEGSPVGVLRSTVEGRIFFGNQAAARMLGAASVADLVGRSGSTLYRDPATRAALVRVLLADGRVENVEQELVGLDGRVLHVLLNATLDDEVITSVLLDVTSLRRAAAERERLEEQLRHAQRLEAVGRLAGGVAHDFNNLLTAITGFASMLREGLATDHPEQESVDGILHSAERAAHLTQSLLAYSRKQVLRPRPVDLRETVRSVERLARRIIGEDVELAVSLPERHLMAVADPAQLEQVLLNLCTNARDAMPGGGRLTMTGDAVQLDPVRARKLDVGPGRYVRLGVADTGEGMGPEVLGRIFEPFFTTKPSGKGTGLGLAIVYGIVRQHGGAVEVESTAGAGTTFAILLPEPPSVAEGERAAARAAGAVPGGRETILLAEDEPLVRQVMRTTLARAGYRVIEASDGAEAVDLFRRHRDEVRLCLLDVMMPRLNGRQALEAIRLVDPAARVLFVSGYAADVLSARGLEEAEAALVQKPVAPEALLRAVRGALDGAHRAPRLG